MIVLVVGWSCTVAILGAYGASRLSGRPRVFDWANVVLFVPTAAANWLAGAPFAAVLSVAFGVIGIYGVTRD